MTKQKSMVDSKKTEITKNHKLITTYYSSSGKVIRRSVQSLNEGESQTQQQFKDECDVNLQMQKYMKTGQFTHLSKSRGFYADMTVFPKDYQDALEIVRGADQAFENLPSDLRSRFDNDPQKLIEFLGDSSNRDEAVNLGLLEKTQLQNDDLNDDNKQQSDKKAGKKSASHNQSGGTEKGSDT